MVEKAKTSICLLATIAVLALAAMLLVACSSKQATSQDNSSITDGTAQSPTEAIAADEDNQSSPNPFGEPIVPEKSDPGTLDIPLNADLNIYTLDFSTLAGFLNTVNGVGATNTYLFNMPADAGLSVWFNFQGGVAAITLNTVVPPANGFGNIDADGVQTHEDYIVNVTNGSSTLEGHMKPTTSNPYEIDRDYFYSPGAPGGTGLWAGGALIFDKNSKVQHITISSHGNFDSGIPIFDTESSSYFPLSDLINTFDGTTLKSIMANYVDKTTPTLYQLTSAQISIADLDNPAANPIYIECSTDGYRVMSQTEISALTIPHKWYPSLTSRQWFDPVLELEGYRYLTLLPYHLQDKILYPLYTRTDLATSLRPILSPKPNSGHSGIDSTDYYRIYSAENIIILCYPTDE
jgi:hypothetical protein